MYLKRKQNTETVVTVKMKKVKQLGKENCWALVLNIYPVIEDGKRIQKREFLNRVITTPIWDITRPRKGSVSQPFHVKRDNNGVIMCESALDKESCAYADQMRKLRQREFDVAHIYEGHEEQMTELEARKKEDFIAYFERLNVQRHPDEESTSRYVWERAIAMFKKFAKTKTVRFDKIDLRLVNNYRLWIQKQTNSLYKKNNVSLSANTSAKYFMLFRAALRQAYFDGYLEVDLHAKTKAILKQPNARDSFSLEEIRKLYATPCKNEVLKRAAMFSALTGLRLSDIRNIRWKQIRNINGSWRLDFIQSKTKQTDYLPISEQALMLCGETGEPEQLIFGVIPKTAWFKKDLNKWLSDAGIERTMTFHCFRHTFATLQLENGTDIYTIKSMLGHTSVNTTQTYSHIVNPALRAAVNLLYIEGLTVEF